MEEGPPVPKKLKLMENVPEEDAGEDHISEVESTASEEHGDPHGNLEAETSSANTSRDEYDESLLSSPEVERAASKAALANLTPQKPSISLPPVKPSADHSVCYQWPWNPEHHPKPHPAKRDWNEKIKEGSVHLPYLKQILHKVGEEKKTHWEVVEENLSKDLDTFSKLTGAIQGCHQGSMNFGVLEYLFDEVYADFETEMIFENILPKMKKLALDLPNLLTFPLHILKGGQSISLTKMQVGSILANAFFCTFPPRKRYISDLPDINFSGLFRLPRDDTNQKECNAEKLKCLFAYFRRITTEKPNGVITYHRRRIEDDDFPRWHESEKQIKKMHVSSSGTIESQGKFMLQMDFANKFLGGGVLGHGCVQEEIRFLICPEFIAGCLFCSVMEKNEAIIICGAEQYCTYSGYGTDFRFEKNFKDETPRDESGRMCTSLVAIDAVPLYRNKYKQYNSEMMDRELSKAYAGFFVDKGCDAIPVATGNWGCGVFGGDPKLKSVLQLLAASQCGRDMVYFTFRDKSLVEQLTNVHEILVEKNATVGQVYRTLLEYKLGRQPYMNVLSFLKKAFTSNFPKPITSFIKVTTPKKEVPRLEISKDKFAEAEKLDAGGPSTVIEIPPTPSPPQEEIQLEDSTHAETVEVLEKSTAATKEKTPKKKALKQTTVVQYFKKESTHMVKKKRSHEED